jgi:hypothetical protein
VARACARTERAEEIRQTCRQHVCGTQQAWSSEEIELDQHCLRTPPQRDVVRWKQRLDEFRFAQQRADRTGRFLPLDAPHLLRKARVGAVGMVGVEVSGYARPQVDALADVDRVRVQAIEHVDTGHGWHFVERLGRKERRRCRPCQQAFDRVFDLVASVPVDQALQEAPQHACIAECAVPHLAVDAEAFDDRIQRVRAAIGIKQA